MENMHTGALLMLASTGSKKDSATLYGSASNRWSATTEEWGLFGLLHAAGYCGSEMRKQSALFGCDRELFERVNFWVADAGKPLTFCRSTKVGGKIFLPKAGIRRAKTPEFYHRTDRAHYGTASLSRNFQPTLAFHNSNFLKHLDKSHLLFNSNYEESGWKNEIHRDWKQQPLVVTGSGILKIENATLRGKVLVTAPIIELGSAAVVQNVIFLADRIVIKSGFQGAAQFIARSELIVEPMVHLNFPSILAVIPKGNNSELLVGPTCDIDGSCLLLQPISFKSSTSRHIMQIKSGTSVQGLVYCEGNLEFEGNLHGALIANRIRYGAGGGIYDNYIVDATVMPPIAQMRIALPLIYRDPGKSELIKWLRH